VSEYKERLPQTVVDNINTAIADLRGVMESENPEVGRACRLRVACEGRGEGWPAFSYLERKRAKLTRGWPFRGPQKSRVLLIVCSSAPRAASALAQEIKGKINALQQAVMKIGENLSGGGGDAGGSGGENVQDAEVKDKP
jgi:hypothetical protein